MKKIEIRIYDREEVIKMRDDARRVINELEGKELTDFGKFRMDNAQKSLAEKDAWLKSNLDTFAVCGAGIRENGFLVDYSITPIKLK